MFSTPKRRYGPANMTFVPSNYFGNGTDGSNTLGENMTPNASGDVMVRNYTSINLQTGYTLFSTSACNGMLLYCQGDCIISGSITMTGKSYAGTGSNDIEIFRFGSGGTTQPSSSVMLGWGTAAITSEQNENWYWNNVGIKRILLRQGGTGGAKGTNTSYPLSRYGRAGSQVTNGCGGGGGGAYYISGNPDYSTDGASGSYSGGGAGGRAGGYIDNWPGGAGGGNITLIVGGNLKISSTGTILANGLNGTNGTDLGGSNAHAGSGGGGGGSITILYAGTYENNGVVQCNGGAGGASAPEINTQGGNGATGSLVISQINR